MSFSWKHTIYTILHIDCWHLAIRILGSSMSFCGLIAHFFLLMKNCPLYGYTTVCLSIHLLKDILAPSRFGYCEWGSYKHKLQGFVWTWVLEQFKYPEVWLLDHIARLCLTLQETTKLSSSGHTFCTSTSNE